MGGQGSQQRMSLNCKGCYISLEFYIYTEHFNWLLFYWPHRNLLAKHVLRLFWADICFTSDHLIALLERCPKAYTGVH